MDLIPGLIDAIQNGMGAFGWLGALAALLSGSVAVFRKMFPQHWDRLPGWAKPLMVFALSGIGAGLLAALGGVALPAALSAGLMAGLSAIGIHQNVKAAKEALAKPKDPFTS